MLHLVFWLFIILSKIFGSDIHRISGEEDLFLYKEDSCETQIFFMDFMWCGDNSKPDSNTYIYHQNYVTSLLSLVSLPL